MADDEILEEIGEPGIDPDEAAGFDEYQPDGAEDGGKEKTVEKDPEEKTAGEEKEDPDKKEDEGEKKEEEEDPDKDKKKPEGEEEETAEQRALKRAERYKEKEDDKTGEDEDKDKGKTKATEEDTGKKPSSITKEQVKTYLEIVPDDDLPDEIIIGNESVDLKGFKENYPEDYGAIKVLAGVMASEVAKDLVENAGYVKADEIKGELSDIKGQLAGYEFWDEVRDVHPDAKTIARSPEFKAWVETQPRHIQALTKVADAGDAIAAIDFYKEDMAKKKAKEHDDKQRDDKKKKDGLYGAGMRNKPSTQKSNVNNDMEDEEAGFNEGLAAIGK